MSTKNLFDLLEAANTKPAVFDTYTAQELWTDEHTSAQMLAYHLNEALDVSSRQGQFIDRSVNWMTQQFRLTNASRICDFGCGPGLYTSRFAQLNARVTGIDFSARSIAYAGDYANRNNLDVTYVEADYLSYQPEAPFDLITMIMCDFCALSPEQRAKLLKKQARLLAAGGRIVLDVYSLAAFDDRNEESYYEKNQLNGFWSASPYYAFVSSFKYEPEKVSLDKYTIVEEHRQKEVYNWLQYFSLESLKREVFAAGLSIEGVYGDGRRQPL